MPPPKHQMPTCPKCGSSDVTLDALATWDVQNQRWEINGTLDNADCNNCLESDITLKWVEINLNAPQSND